MNLRTFESWLDEIKDIQRPRTIYNINQWRQDNRGGRSTSDWVHFIASIQSLFGTAKKHTDSAIRVGGHDLKNFSLHAPSPCGDNFLPELVIESVDGPVALHGLSVKYLEITGPGGAIAELTDLNVDTLYINTNGEKSYFLRDCFIGTLRINATSVKDFDVSGGCILSIECPSPIASNPFGGSVFFDGTVHLPRKSGGRLLGPQPYRNLRAHMLKLENAPMASRFHSLEQSIERAKQGLFDRIISIFYRAFSDYGSSSTRPALWLLILLVFTYVILVATDGTMVSSVEHIKGWQQVLLGDGCMARLSRALVQTINSTINPLGIFSAASLVVAKSGLLAIWLAIHGILSALCFVFLVFALRRRYKIT